MELVEGEAPKRADDAWQIALLKEAGLEYAHERSRFYFPAYSGYYLNCLEFSHMTTFSVGRGRPKRAWTPKGDSTNRLCECNSHSLGTN